MLKRSASQTSRSGLSRAAVVELLRRLGADAGEWALDRADHVGQADLGRRAGEAVPALGAALGEDHARMAQLGEDVLEERQGDPLGFRDRLTVDGPRRAAASSTAARTA